MLLNIAIILISGLIASYLCKKIGIPTLIGMIFSGILIKTYGNVQIPSNISSDLRTIALIVILIRAGLSLELDDIKKIGRPSFLLSFIPASVEMIAIIFFAPKIFGISYFEAAIIGSIIAAVSPAVIVPRMIKLIDTSYGREHKVPEIILAGSTIDDIFVIAIFSSLISGKLNILSILSTIILAIITGYILSKIFNKLKFEIIVKVMLLFVVSFTLLSIKQISALLAIMLIAVFLKNKEELKPIYAQLWRVFEIFLFVLVGMQVDVSYALNEGPKAILLVFVALLFRILSVFICLINTKLTAKERLFCALSYIPKATVQAAIGAIPLSMGLAVGNLALTMAVLAILITAPIGAFLIDKTYKIFLI